MSFIHYENWFGVHPIASTKIKIVKKKKVILIGGNENWSQKSEGLKLEDSIYVQYFDPF